MKTPSKDYVGAVVARGDDAFQYGQVGLCGYCIREIEALQPGGTEARHVDGGIAYGNCPEALRSKLLKSAAT